MVRIAAELLVVDVASTAFAFRLDLASWHSHGFDVHIYAAIGAVDGRTARYVGKLRNSGLFSIELSALPLSLIHI